MFFWKAKHCDFTKLNFFRILDDYWTKHGHIILHVSKKKILANIYIITIFLSLIHSACGLVLAKVGQLDIFCNEVLTWKLDLWSFFYEWKNNYANQVYQVTTHISVCRKNVIFLPERKRYLGPNHLLLWWSRHKQSFFIL